VATDHTISLRHAVAVSNTFALLLAVAMVAPLLRLPQLFTGSIVNATLLVATVALGPRAAVTLGFLPSAFALMSGQLPARLAPLVPLIVTGNALLVVVFHWARRRGWWVGVVAAAVAKFCWLFGTTSLLSVAIGLAGSAATLALTLMGWPQLVTALSGGVIAFAVLKPARRL
jgi:hypothetical protein